MDPQEASGQPQDDPSEWKGVNFGRSHCGISCNWMDDQMTSEVGLGQNVSLLDVGLSNVLSQPAKSAPEMYDSAGGGKRTQQPEKILESTGWKRSSARQVNQTVQSQVEVQARMRRA